MTHAWLGLDRSYIGSAWRMLLSQIFAASGWFHTSSVTRISVAT
jgi:hypothetical protein